MGFPTAGGPVPIVVALGLFDLAEGDGSVRPGAAEGYAACEAASALTAEVDLGSVGAGTGATVAKWRGRDTRAPRRHRRRGRRAMRTWWSPRSSRSTPTATCSTSGDTEPRVPPPPVDTAEASFTNTTIGVVATNASSPSATACSSPRAGTTA